MYHIYKGSNFESLLAPSLDRQGSLDQIPSKRDFIKPPLVKRLETVTSKAGPKNATMLHKLEKTLSSQLN